MEMQLITSVLELDVLELGALVKVLRPITRAEEYEYRAKYLKDDFQMSGDGPKAAEFRIDNALRHMPLEPDDVVLDISAGKGLLFEKIHRRVKECHGVDVAPAIVERVRQKFQNYANVKFETAFANNLPFPDAMFDKVFMTGAFCLQETYEECMQSLSEIRRVAKDTATIFLSDIAVVDESQFVPERVTFAARLKRRLAQDNILEFLANARRAAFRKIRNLTGREPVLIESTRGIWFPHETFVRMCKENRLAAIGFQTQHVSGPSPTRFDYLIKPL